MEEFEIRWIADFRTPHISIQYCPVFEGLDPNVSATLHTPFQKRPFPSEIAGDLTMLQRIMLGIAPSNAPPLDGIEWQIEIHTFERDITPTYAGRERSCWLELNYQFKHPLGGYDNKQLRWEEGDLSPEVTSLVRRIDEYASFRAHAHWATRYNEVATQEKTGLTLPPPIRVYLSYRGGRADVEDLVKRVHGELSLPGRKSYFNVFYDKSDLLSGDWKQQLYHEIQQSDVFIPLLSSDYEDGEFPRWEYDTASRFVEEQGKPQIVPLLLEGSWSDHESASRINGVYFPVECDEALFFDAVGRLTSLLVSASIDS